MDSTYLKTNPKLPNPPLCYLYPNWHANPYCWPLYHTDCCCDWSNPPAPYTNFCLCVSKMEEVQEVLKVFESSLSLIKWRLRPSSKRRLETGRCLPFSFLFPPFLIFFPGSSPWVIRQVFAHCWCLPLKKLCNRDLFSCV